VPFEKSGSTEFWLRIEQSILTAMEKSAEGIVGIRWEIRLHPRGVYRRPERFPFEGIK
jgi:hypothetical protein